jgi:hypothetical protein
MQNCTFLAGWACQQPGSPGGYLPEIEGPRPIPGPGGTQFTDALGVPQGWGEVPLERSFSCWCSNPAGTYANLSTGCAAEVCPYPNRCVDGSATRNNGTVCTTGAEGIACISCSKRYYRFRDECRKCPEGVPVSIVLLAIGVGVFLLFIGPRLSKLASPQAAALLRSFVMYLQYLSLSLDIRLSWPPALLSFFSWLKALTNGIDLAAPECVSDTWSCASPQSLRVRLRGVACCCSRAS